MTCNIMLTRDIYTHYMHKQRLLRLHDTVSCNIDIANSFITIYYTCISYSLTNQESISQGDLIHQVKNQLYSADLPRHRYRCRLTCGQPQAVTNISWIKLDKVFVIHTIPQQSSALVCRSIMVATYRSLILFSIELVSQLAWPHHAVFCILHGLKEVMKPALNLYHKVIEKPTYLMNTGSDMSNGPHLSWGRISLRVIVVCD